MQLQIDALTASDIPSALRLSSGAGWNQIEADWQRLIEIWPGSCLAGRVAGELVATATLAVYGNVGWVGMVLVDPAHQRKGCGSTMLDEIISLADASGVKTLGLDATDQGRPVYLKKGFADQIGIDRWKAQSGGPWKESKPIARKLQAEDWESIVSLDRTASGLMREASLRKLATQPGAIIRIAGSPVRAFGLGRPGRTAFHIGPVIGKSQELVADVLDAILLELSQSKIEMPVIIDIPGESFLAGSLAPRGFQITRKLTRMLRPATAAQSPHNKIAAAACGFELG